VCKHPKALGASNYTYYRTISVGQNASWSQSNNDGGSKIMQLAKKCPTMALGAIFYLF